uniref:cystathionine gamma-lyase n=1 Tax=Globodera pallida TaxID=36090 RepID=A0A183BN54_GLOPA
MGHESGRRCLVFMESLATSSIPNARAGRATNFVVSTTYKQFKPEELKGHDYSRAGNPTRDELQENIASLEGARFSRVFSSGLGATAAMANWLRAGDHFLMADDGYGGTQRYFRCMVWFESPSNPLLKVIDIEAVSKLVKAHSSESIVVVDNTFMSPFFQNPLALGADVVLHSLTKYINGHSDVVMGCLVTNSEQLDAHFLFQQLGRATNFVVSTTYKPEELKGHDYSRAGNPTRDELQENIASLEGARFSRVFSSGLGATAAMANWLRAGDHLIMADDGYGGTQRYFRDVSVAHHGVQLSFVDMTKLDDLRAALRPNTKMVWFESPSNPLLKVIDIEAVSKAVKAHNPESIVVVDNTFMSPFFQNPLALGADVVLHSLTKYINGHSDVVMGSLVTNSERLDAHFLFQQLAVGSVPSSFDVYLVLRGIKTLHLRMGQHQTNATAVARWLKTDPRVEKVLYPALKCHPQHEVHKKQATGMSGMISFYLRTDLEGSQKFLANLELFTLAESLGGYESLAELPALMTHASVPSEIHQKLGIGNNLIRLSVGCEYIRDLIRDLDIAMNVATGRSRDE